MRWSYHVATLWGIKIKLHITFVFLLVLFILSQGMRAGLFICLVFLTVLLHELGHGVVAKSKGVRVEDIILLPIGGMARIRDIPERPKDEIAIAVAGPAVNFVLVAVIELVRLVISGALGFGQPSLASGTLLENFIWTNLMLGGFNLLPAFPMDGGRILRAVLALRYGYPKATRIAASVGEFFALCLMFFGVFYNWWLALIGVFIYIGAASEERAVSLRTVLRPATVRSVMAVDFQSISPQETLGELMEQVYRGYQKDFPVVWNNSVIGLVTKSDLISALHKLPKETRVAESMRREFPFASPDMHLSDAYQQMSEEQISAMPVVDSGRLVGLLTLEQIANFLLLSGDAKKEFHLNPFE